CHPIERDPRVHQDHPPGRREDAGGGLPNAGLEGAPAAARSDRRVDGGADPSLQALHGGLPSPDGGDLHRDRVAARRARDVPRVGRLVQAVPPPRPRAELRQPPSGPAAHARRPDVRHGHDHLDGGPRHGRGRSVSRFTQEARQRADEIVALYPHARSATLPLCHLAQEQDGYLAPDAIVEIAELTGTTPAEARGTASFYDMFHLEPVGTYVVGVCTNIACLLAGGLELLEHAERSLGV